MLQQIVKDQSTCDLHIRGHLRRVGLLHGAMEPHHETKQGNAASFTSNGEK